MDLLSAIPVVGGVVKFLIKEASDWSKRRDAIKAAEMEAKVATIKAQTEIAVYKAKADVEWDLAWAGQAQYSWKDEWLMILWSIPLVVFMLAMPFDALRDNVKDTLEFAKSIEPEIITFYLYGWGAIFAATFGLKGLAQGTLGSKVATITEAFSKVDDDIPDEAVKAAADRVQKALASGASGLY